MSARPRRHRAPTSSVRRARAALVASCLLALPATAEDGIEFIQHDGVIEAVLVGNFLFEPGELLPGTSTGAVEFVTSGGGPIDAADDLDLDTYFARNGGVGSAWDVNFGSWTDPHASTPDFFAFEVGGNDSLKVQARLSDGTLGKSVTLSGWTGTGWVTTDGPNVGQEVHVLPFSVTDLKDGGGQLLGSGAALNGVRLLSNTIDGASFLRAVSAPKWKPLPRPELTLSPGRVPWNDTFATVVELRAEPYASGGPTVGTYDLVWNVPGAQFVQGTTKFDPVAKVTVSGIAPVDVEVVVTHATYDALTRKARDQIGTDHGTATLHGTRVAWHPLELWFDGPTHATTDDAPNPFLDYRLDVTFTRPDGSTIRVPGFFDGDGRGGSSGGVWKARLAADVGGTWTWVASFRQGTDVAVDPALLAGAPTSFDGATGAFDVAPLDHTASGFLRHGLLEYVGEHYLRFRDGTWFLKGGTNSPENLLGFHGFVDVEKQGGFGSIHDFAPHLSDWDPADPDVPFADFHGSRAIFGVINWLAAKGVNSVYFLPMNLGGDAQDTSPFVGYLDDDFDKTHYHVERLLQWEELFRHATRKGVQLQVVLSETEKANEEWFDGGAVGVQRRLFLREMVARFAHHLAVKWTVGEESDFSLSELQDMAAWIRGLDPYDHPIAVHNPLTDLKDYQNLLGHPDYEATSFQYDDDLGDMLVEDWRAQSAAAGRKWVLDMDEQVNPDPGGVNPWNIDDARRRTMWDVYLSGGNLEWYLGYYDLPVGGDASIEDFATREALWDYTRIARELVETTPFWEMQPMDSLLSNESSHLGGGEVFAKPGEVYLVYLPKATSTGRLDLSSTTSRFELRWYSPVTGHLFPVSAVFDGGDKVDLPAPPHSPDQDWAARVQLVPLWCDESDVSVASGGVHTMQLDGGPSLAGVPYLLLGSLSGTSPGLTVTADVHVPLNPDAYFFFTAVSPNQPPLGGGVGVLDAQGRATVTLTIPAGTQGAFAGVQVFHAWVGFTPEPWFVSNAVQLDLVP